MKQHIPAFYENRAEQLKNTLRIMLMSHIAQALSDNGVEHGKLRFIQNSVQFPATATYMNLTDGSHVFIKFLDGDEGVNKALLQREVDFAIASEYGDVPLLDRVQTVPNFGETDEEIHYSVWEWDERVQDVYFQETWAGQAATELAQFHGLSSTTTNSIAQYNRALTDEHHYAKLLDTPAITSFTGMHTSALLRQVFVEYIQRTAGLLRRGGEGWVISHGQLDLDNIVVLKRNYAMRLANCMYVRSAPREYDLSFLFYRLVLEKQEPRLWEAFLKHYLGVTGVEVDDGLILQFVKVLLSEILIERAAQTKTSFQSVSVENFVSDRFLPALRSSSLQELTTVF